MTTPYKIIRALLVSTSLLLIPYIASFVVDGMLWTGSDFVFAWIMFSFLALAFSFVMGSTRPSSYKMAVAIGAVSAFLLVWVTGAVGIIGDGDINLLYAIVALILVAGSLIVRMRAAGMAYVLYAAALVQFAIPFVALSIGAPDFSPGVLQVIVLNGFWVAMFIVSGVLFSDAAKTR